MLVPVTAAAVDANESLSPVAPKSHVLALSLAYQAPLGLDKSGLGGGVTYTREYFITARTALGVHASLRVFPDAPRHIALGYGLTFKHYIVADAQRQSIAGLYLVYGLLLQMNFLQDREGSATGHDTRLAIGLDWSWRGVFPLVELGYHLTQVRNFEQPTLWWAYTELATGIRF
jgi:hypothetical protein